MRKFMFRALITLSPAGPAHRTPLLSAMQYPSHTLALVILAHPLRANSGPARYLPTELWREDEAPLRPGDRVLVTARVTDDHGDQYLDAGQRFTLWSSGEVGRGIVYRRVFTGHSPP
ncbi:MAG: hypothetical protein ACRDNO_24420 [Trebonia sp.]